MLKNKQVRFNQLLITIVSSLLMVVMIMSLPKQAVAQSINLDMIIRNDANANPNLRYYLYDENGTLLEDRNVSNNTTVFASRYQVEKFILQIKNSSDEIVKQWELVVGVEDTISPPPPPPTPLSNYIYSDTTDPDVSAFTVHRFFSTTNQRIGILDYIMETDTLPVKGFGTLNRGFLKYGDGIALVSKYGYGMSDDFNSGKTFWYNYWSVTEKWYGFVIEREFAWFSAYLLFKLNPPPQEPTNGMLYGNTDGNLIWIKGDVEHRVLTTEDLEMLMGLIGQ